MSRARTQGLDPPLDGELHPHPDAISRRLGDQLVLVNLSDNRIFELNPTGARVWELLEETGSRDQLVARLRNEFDVDPARLAGEVDALLRELFARGLVT